MDLITGDETQLQGATLGCKVLEQRLDELQATKIARLYTKSGAHECETSEISVKYFLQQPINSSVIPMVCDADAFGGGWLVIQQRLHGGLSFQRDWQEYKNGFGTVGKSNEFWLGLERMHRLTKNEPCELVIELRDESGRYGYARYSGFKVAGEDDSYRLSDDLSFVEGSSIVDNMIGSRRPDVKPFIENCNEVEKSGTNFFRPAGFSEIFPVLCVAEAYGGGWVVLQQRINGTENFNRDWNDYKHGFGTVGKSTEFWLGLEQMHQITNRYPYELLIEVKNEEGQHGYATFSKFKVADESDGYRLFDEFRWSEGMINFGLQLSHGEKFSTYDKDNDKSEENCGSLYKKTSMARTRKTPKLIEVFSGMIGLKLQLTAE
ncbi:fibrinogen and fibronectin [Culex quinquefasciatus]|uniref:Fibrinogen and fibronectin n=1 Tax=Culex quinquefasciatus TaxID=7176 RepID=B0X1W6_CULQU|nr:fibrinogen and fibronectin [Culex quinquefasciatus]|eukprot:XP_001863638.1 fibrinogen and fibronectin [Culex quinquefasciatus]